MRRFQQIQPRPCWGRLEIVVHLPASSVRFAAVATLAVTASLACHTNAASGLTQPEALCYSADSPGNIGIRTTVNTSARVSATPMVTP